MRGVNMHSNVEVTGELDKNAVSVMWQGESLRKKKKENYRMNLDNFSEEFCWKDLSNEVIAGGEC